MYVCCDDKGAAAAAASLLAHGGGAWCVLDRPCSLPYVLVKKKHPTNDCFSRDPRSRGGGAGGARAIFSTAVGIPRP